jgi:hypothetical protein
MRPAVCSGGGRGFLPERRFDIRTTRHTTSECQYANIYIIGEGSGDLIDIPILLCDAGKSPAGGPRKKRHTGCLAGMPCSLSKKSPVHRPNVLSPCDRISARHGECLVRRAEIVWFQRFEEFKFLKALRCEPRRARTLFCRKRVFRQPERHTGCLAGMPRMERKGLEMRGYPADKMVRSAVFSQIHLIFQK